MKLNELCCPDCNDRMFVIYDTNEKYAAHGCRSCLLFHILGNVEDYEA